MGRKRLLTLLAAMTATVALNAAPAAAQLSLPGLGELKLGPNDDSCLEVGVDVALGDLLSLDPSVCVLGEDGEVLDVDGKVKLGEEELDLGEATKPVTDAVNRGGSSSPATPSDDADPAPRSGSGSQPEPTTPRPTPRAEDDAAEEPEVGPAAFSEANPRQDQAILLAQLQEDLARQRRADVVFGPVAPGVGDPGIAAAPEVADSLGAASEVTPGVTPSPAAPEVAPQPQREEAILASGPASTPAPGVPAALQLLTGAMVLGAATVWHLARREYGGSAPTAV